MRQSRERSENEMQEFKEEMRVFRVEMNKRWGELANRLGTLAEDFVAPNIPFIAQKYFQCPEEAEIFMVRCKKRYGVDDLTVDYATRLGIYVLAIKGDTMDLLNYSSLKSTA